MSEKYKDLSIDEIQSMIKELNDELDRRLMEFKNSLVGKVLLGSMKSAGLKGDEIITAEQLQEAISQWMPKANVTLPEAKKKRIVGPKYMHPITKEVWAGRGAFAPKWVQDVLKEKKITLDDFKNSIEFKIRDDE